MAWLNYHFIDLSTAEKQARRQTLDQYALYAQLSALIPVAAVLLYRLAKRATNSGASSNGRYAAVPSSPVLKERRNSNGWTWSSRTRRAQWWLGEDVVVAGTVRGQRDQWLVGILWTAWLLLLSVSETGEDYLHLTKRLGLVAVSQWPLQYLLALKSLNPVAYLLRSSHERVNRWHRVLARITTTLLYLHAALYLNFFVQRDRLDRLVDPVVFAGVVAFLGLNLLVTTALRRVRRFSYRLFFIIHLVGAIIIPLMIIVHAAPARAFLFEALGVFLVDLVSRKMDTVTGNATMETIPGTNLVKISASIPQAKVNRFRAHPGSHIYLSIPDAARKSMSSASISHLLFEFLFNPFTVAAVDQNSGDLTLVARHCGGPMTAALGRLAGVAKNNSSSSRNGAGVDKIPLSIEGPYGAAGRFPQLGTDFDRILLVAGGVGATFTLPLYRSIVNENPGARVEMVWALRGAGDATWAMTGTEAQALLRDDNIHLFVTGDTVDPQGLDRRTNGQAEGSRVGRDEGGQQVELSALYRDRRRDRYTSQHSRKRPDLKNIVDDLFKYGPEERVAVLVCGPNEMARELREHVGVWVKRGRPVWYHKEGFGF
ncbi:Ferric/cupric reductase transmembrane component 2 [Chaetomidium leptoderma]|uniref:Ferric/cupric reductase transmembrane component 2 n=1 Tax=Chaetomidium leptoderma TaxID=669021 RepID=A0AAN6VN96_9PEZI|nr:Ferric/cupric reductase transmembrane component 2 [Chaetomidium leptoderma]